MPESALRAMRWKEISYLPQGSMHVLNPVRKIKDTFRDFISAHSSMSSHDSDEMVSQYLLDLGLPEKVLNSYPHQLSGGMRQRVTIALATILSPNLVLADEPTTALDVLVQRGVIQLLDDIRHRNNMTIVVVTHDMGVHANFSERIAVLYAGQVIDRLGGVGRRQSNTGRLQARTAARNRRRHRIVAGRPGTIGCAGNGASRQRVRMRGRRRVLRPDEAAGSRGIHRDADGGDGGDPCTGTHHGVIEPHPAAARGF